MQIRTLGMAATMLIVGVAVAGCAEQADQTGQQPSSAQITVDGGTVTAQRISCSQVGWLLTIQTAADPANASAMLRLGGIDPAPLTVNLENFDNFHGVSGESVDGAEASAKFADGIYTITGTALGRDSDHPATDRTADFRIEARC